MIKSIVSCDGYGKDGRCQKTTDLNSPGSSWLVLKWFRSAEGLGTDTSAWHFCSWDCARVK